MVNLYQTFTECLQRIAKPYCRHFRNFPLFRPCLYKQTTLGTKSVALVTSLGRHVGKCGATTPLAGCSYVVINI